MFYINTPASPKDGPQKTNDIPEAEVEHVHVGMLPPDGGTWRGLAVDERDPGGEAVNAADDSPGRGLDSRHAETQIHPAFLN